MELRLENFLNFPLWFTINNFRHWSFVVWAMGLGLVILGQKIHMKDRVNLHRWREGQAISYGGQFPVNKEWSISVGC